MEALVASAPAKEDVSLGKIEVTNTEQSKESGTTQILILNCTLEYAAVCSSAVICRSGVPSPPEKTRGSQG